MERATFRADIRIQKGYAYLNFDFADITSGPLARCDQSPSPPPPSLFFSPSRPSSPHKRPVSTLAISPNTNACTDAFM